MFARYQIRMRSKKNDERLELLIAYDYAARKYKVTNSILEEIVQCTINTRITPKGSET